MKDAASLLDLLRRRAGFRRLWLGEVVSLFGDWMSYVAVSVLALEAGQGATELAVVFAAHMLPAAIVSPVAGVVADRMDRRTLMIAAQLGQALIVVGMMASAAAGQLALVPVLLALRTAVAALFYPAKQAAMRAVVDESELVDANAIDAASWSVTFSLGTAIGGAIALLGPVAALGLDALTFVIAAIIFARLPALPVGRLAPARLALTRELREATRTAWGAPALFEAVVSKMPQALVGGAGWVVLNLAATDFALVGSAALAIGLLQGVRGVGSGIGPLAARAWLRGDSGATPRSLMRGMVALTVGSVAVVTLLAPVAGTALGAAAMTLATFAWGAGAGGNWVLTGSETQRLAPPHELGRLASLDQLGFTLCTSVSAMGAGLLIDATGSLPAGGLFGVVVAALVYAALRGMVALRERGLQAPQPA